MHSLHKKSRFADVRAAAQRAPATLWRRDSNPLSPMYLRCGYSCESRAFCAVVCYLLGSYASCVRECEIRVLVCRRRLSSRIHFTHLLVARVAQPSSTLPGCVIVVEPELRHVRPDAAALTPHRWVDVREVLTCPTPLRAVALLRRRASTLGVLTLVRLAVTVADQLRAARHGTRPQGSHHEATTLGSTRTRM